MSRRSVKAFKNKYSHYVRWNILCCWMFGLWMALCTSDIYYTKDWNRETETAYKIVRKKDTMETLSCVILQNYNTWTLLFKSREIIRIFQIFTCVFLVITIICIQRNIRKGIEAIHVLLGKRLQIYTLCTSTDMWIENYSSDGKTQMYEHDCNHLESCQLINRKEIEDYFVRMLNYDDKQRLIVENEDTRNGSIDVNVRDIQNQIVLQNFWGISNNSKIDDDPSSNKKIESKKLSVEYSMIQNLNQAENKFHSEDAKTEKNLDSDVATSMSETEDITNKLEVSNNDDSEINSNGITKNNVKARIISSSPEFQKFLWSLKDSRFSPQCMLEACNF